MISEVITIDDEEDDDPISEMKLNLHETYLKCQVSGAGDLLGLDSYSPTQSPVYVAPGSPDPSSFPVVDLTSPYSPPQSPSPPPLPPLPPPVPSRVPTPPPPPSMSPIKMTVSSLSFPHPVPTTSGAPEAVLSKHGEPLPPGEDRDPTSPPVPQDMDIDPGTPGTETAETNFFLSQQNLFPASVWDFSTNQRALSVPRHSRDLPTAETDVTEEKKRKHEDVDTEESHTSQDEVNEDEFEEEEASLRSLLLAQVGMKKKSKLSEGLKDESAKQQDEKKTNESSQIDQTLKGLSASPQKKARKVKQRENSKANIKQSQVPGIKKSKSKTKTRPKQVKISDAEQKKYFPNLSKKIVVNFSGNESDSDSSDNDIVSNDNQSDQSKSNPVKDSLFGLDLEAFLKQARNSSELNKTQQENQMKVTKKIAMTPKLKAKASELTLADKKRLISAKITHLSKSKQLEYQRLKEILAKKQLEKKLKTQKTNEPTKQVVDHPKALEKSHSITEEEEEALRSNLIQNMIKSKKSEIEHEAKGEKAKNGTVKETSTEKDLLLSPQKTVNTKPKMSIELSGDSREVKLNHPDREDSENTTQLKKLETDVVEMRKGLSASLFKLSAYMSQLQKETSGVDSAVNYIAELKKQLEETEKLLSTREKKVDSLKEVIKESHQQITIQKQEMSSVEERCRSEGFKLFGADYKPPVEGAENIRKKLEMIRSTAMKVKTTALKSESNSGEGKSGNNEGGAGAGPGLPGDYRSPLEHLSQTNKPLVDHSKEVCRYDLSGKCLDPGCQLQHLASL